MHRTSYDTMREFVRVHLDDVRGREIEVLDFGSQVVGDQQLSYRDLIDDPNWRYRGLDIEPGRNVDIVVADAYDWSEVEGDSVDLVISGQALEHVEYFWASMFEIVRVLAPGGVGAIIAPSGGWEHRYPVDCWRFYPDGFTALARYVGVHVVDVFTAWDQGDWEDSIIVVEKPSWNDEERRTFALRAAMQRALLAPDPAAVDLTALPEPGAAAEVSPLRERIRGALTEALERRSRKIAADKERAAAKAAEADAARIDADVDRRVAERLARITPIRLYGRARGAVASAVGPRGRAAYRRVRRRVGASNDPR